MTPNKEFVKGFAGISTKGSHPEPWQNTHFGQSVAPQAFDNGKLWSFGSGTATCKFSGGEFHVAGRPFHTRHDRIPLAADVAGLRTLLSDLDGRYSLFCCLPTGEMLVATDWLGLGPVFIAEIGGAVYWATHLGLLLDLLTELPPIDQVGVASMLAGTTLIGGRTPYAGIRRLMAGEMAIIGDGDASRLTIQQYIDPIEVLTAGRVDHTKTDEQFDHLLKAAASRENFDCDRSVLMLSGGRDSRALAYVLTDQRRDAIPAATFGRNSSLDVRIARQTATALQLPHSRIPYDNWTLDGEAPFVVRVGGGASGLQTAHHIVAYRAIADRADVAITGFLGDASTGAHLNYPGNDALVMSRLHDWQPSLMESYADEIRILQAELRQIENRLNDLAPHQRRLFIDYTNRQATWISQTFSLCSWFIDVSAPFMQRDLLSFLFNLPEHDLQEQALYDRWLAQKAKKLRQIPQLTSTIIKHRTSLTSAIERVVCRGLNLSNPNPVVDWLKVQRDSFDWFEESIRQFTDDDRLRKTAERELMTIRQARRIAAPSPLLYALAILRARTDRRIADVHSTRGFRPDGKCLRKD